MVFVTSSCLLYDSAHASVIFDLLRRGYPWQTERLFQLSLVVAEIACVDLEKAVR